MLFFTQHFGISASTPVEFLDIPIDGDMEFFIDPFLIANNRQFTIFDDVYHQLRGFFVMLNRSFIVPNDRTNGLRFLDNLHEPNEYHLGYSASNKGAAISDTRAEAIFTALRGNRFTRVGFGVTNEAHNVLLLVTGIGQDIMSDTIANVCRNIFAQFTTEQCIKHGIPTATFERHYFNSITSRWESAIFELPSYLGKPIILLPHKIISSTRSYVNHYNYFIAGNRIAPDILAGLMDAQKTKALIKTLKDGSKMPIVKLIYKEYRKPKKDLVEHVLKYTDSLDDFLDYAKTQYPSVDV